MGLGNILSFYIDLTSFHVEESSIFCRQSVQFEIHHDKVGGHNNRAESNGRLETAKKKKTKSVKMENKIVDPVTTECSISDVLFDNKFLETSL